MNMKMPMPAPAPEAPTTHHGFNLLGRKSLVLSHIPMFMPPHEAQVFLEVSIDGPPGTDPVKAYLDDLATSGTTEYVLVTDPIQLPTLAPGAAHGIDQFTGKLYRGWPFADMANTPVVAAQLTVHIKHKIYWASILHKPILKTLTYLGFRTHETDYMVHQLAEPPDLKNLPKPPDFCQILNGRIEGIDTTLDHLQKKGGVAHIELPGVDNNVAHKLTASHSAKGKVAGHHGPVELQPEAELIFDPNHLVM